MSLTNLEFSIQTCPCGKETSLGRFIYCDSCRHFICPDCMEEARALGGGEDVNGTGVNLCGLCIDSGKGLKLIFPEASLHKVRFYTIKIALPGEEPFTDITIRSDHLLTGIAAAENDLTLALSRRGYYDEKTVEIALYQAKRLAGRRYGTVRMLGYEIAMAIEHDLREWPLLMGV
jgi:hypothetical protein